METTDSWLWFRRYSLHGFRVGCLLLIVLLIRAQHVRRMELRAEKRTAIGGTLDHQVEFGLGDIRRTLPEAAGLSPGGTHGSWVIRNSTGKRIGFALQTAPASDGILGFSGPTNVLMVFDDQWQLLNAEILSSHDTRDHVQQVRQDPRFWEQFRSIQWSDEQVKFVFPEAVSGATLTSRAIQEAVIWRLKGERPSLRFPDPPQLEHVRAIVPNAVRLRRDEQQVGIWRVLDGASSEIAWLLRTTPAADQVIGFQGPTEALLVFDLQGKAIGLVVGNSFDNEPYVSYVREDAYFRQLFDGWELRDLAQLDLTAAGIEGVSGATMTSVAVAESLRRSAQAALEPPSAAARKDGASRPELTWGDLGTGIIVLLAVLMGVGNWKTRKNMRLLFQGLLIGYLGLVNGDLISQAMLFGWARHGVPWSTAVGLVLLTAAAVLVPLTTGKNLYCSHVCPHGAAQQLLRNRLPPSYRWRVPAALRARRRWLPTALLVLCLLVTMTGASVSLVDLEPFDAWVFQVAGAATLTLAILSLIASLFVPMAYCRFGCPTGTLLEYLRLDAHSHKVSQRDLVVLGLVAVASLLACLGP